MELIFPRLVTEERPPLSMDDSSRGYVVGQPWIDVGPSTATSYTARYYVCVKNTVGAAVWTEVQTAIGFKECCSNINSRLLSIEQILAGILDEMSTGVRADFTFTPSSGDAPLTIQFTDISVGDVTDYTWVFGDGVTSNQQNPTHIYTDAGTYTPSLTIKTSSGEVDVKTSLTSIVVSEALNAEFVADFLNIIKGTQIQFTDTSKGIITSWHWEFGDGAYSDVQNPSHTYTTAGTYTVSLNITSDTGADNETKVGFITVTESGINPVAKFTATPTSGTLPLSVQFVNQSTGTATNYSWNFGDGSTSISANPSHIYTTAGNYTVSLTVTGNGQTSTYTENNFIQVSNTAPVASFNASATTGQAPVAIQFTDTSTGTITTWSWDFGDGSTSNIQNPTHTYSSAGTYTVKLTVTGSGGSDTEEKTSLIIITSTSISANFTADTTTGIAPLAVNFTDSSTGTISSWSWNFGDGSTSTEQNPSHTYTTVGTYSVTLQVSGTNGTDTKIRSSYITITATQTVPNAAFTATPLTGVKPLAVTFTDSSTGTITSRLWNFGDGYTSTEINPSHTYTTDGSYTVSLQVTGPLGTDTETKSSLITVGNTSTDAQIIDPSLKYFAVDVSSWAAGTWTAPSGWTVQKVNSNTGIQITHNLNLAPSAFTLINSDNGVYSPSTSVRTLNVDSLNVVTYTQCVVNDAFSVHLLFPSATLTSGSRTLIYRVAVTDWSASAWNIPNGWTCTKTSSNVITLTYNNSTDPVYWNTSSFTINAINNLSLLGNKTCKVTLPSTISNSFTIDLYFLG